MPTGIRASIRRLVGATGNRQISVFVVLLIFTIIGTVRHLSVPGEDLSSSYFGCKVLALGQGEHLYSHDPEDFTAVGDPVWEATALAAGYTQIGMVHPYVQTPLWAYVLRPLCTGMGFSAFNQLFVVLLMLCTSGTIWIVTRYWAVHMFHPGWVALVCAGLYLSEPFKYALYLNQTHMLFVFLTIAALALAPRGHPVWAGGLLALAAAVKITPGLIVIYWLATRQTKAAASFAITSIALLGLTVLAVGQQMVGTYLHLVSELSNVLLIAFNNQSFAAWWQGWHFARTEMFFWDIYFLPGIVKTLSLLLALGAAGVGGLLDRGSSGREPARPPYGAVFAVLGTMIATPIAWSHYYVLLVIPILLLLDDARSGRKMWPLMSAMIIFMLNVYPLAYGSVAHRFHSYSLVRSQFYAGLVALTSMVLLVAQQRTRGPALQEGVSQSTSATA